MNERLSMQDFVDLLAAKHGMSKREAERFVKEFFLLIEQALENDRCVKIKGFGTFKLVDVDSRESVKVNTGERFEIQGHTKISFVPDTVLRNTINKPFEHFETVVLNENTVLEDTLVEETEEEPDEPAELAENLEVEKEVVADEPAIVVAIEEPLNEESPAESPLVEDVVPQLSAEDIIAAELRKAEKEFKSVVIPPEKPENQSGKRPPEKPVSDKQTKEKSATPYLVVIIVLVLLLCSGALLFVYYPDLFSFGNQKEIVQTPAPQPVIKQEILPDTLIVPKDTVAEVVRQSKEVVPEEVRRESPDQAKIPVKTVDKAATPVKPDSVNYKISGTKTTYTIKEGETLTRISLRFYGTKDLWPYIVQHNRDVIKNPDNVPYGTTLRIPELVKR